MIANAADEGLTNAMMGLSEPALGAGTQGADRFAASRRAMIESQLRPSGVNDPRILAAMAALPREDFVPPERRAVAYSDRRVPLGGGRFLAPPISHGLMLTEARPTAEDSALLIGGATGYLAALVAPLVGSLHVLESDAELAARAVRTGESWSVGPLEKGGKASAPYTLILVDGAIEVFPDTLTRQLADNGRVVTGLLENDVTRLAVGRKAAGQVGFLSLLEADFPLLPGFAAPRKWSF